MYSKTVNPFALIEQQITKPNYQKRFEFPLVRKQKDEEDLDENTIWKINDLKIKRVSTPKSKQTYFNVIFKMFIIAVIFFIVGVTYGNYGEQDCFTDSTRQILLKTCREEYYSLECDKDDNKKSVRCVNMNFCLQNPESYQKNLKITEMKQFFEKIQQQGKQLLIGSLALLLLIMAKVKNCL